MGNRPKYRATGVVVSPEVAELRRVLGLVKADQAFMKHASDVTWAAVIAATRAPDAVTQ